MGGKIGKTKITETPRMGSQTPIPRPLGKRDKGPGSPYMEDIFKVNSASVLQHWSPPRPLSINVVDARAREYFPWGPGCISINIDCEGARGKQVVLETAEKYSENILHVLNE